MRLVERLVQPNSDSAAKSFDTEGRGERGACRENAARAGDASGLDGPARTSLAVTDPVVGVDVP